MTRAVYSSRLGRLQGLRQLRLWGACGRAEWSLSRALRTAAALVAMSVGFLGLLSCTKPPDLEVYLVVSEGHPELSNVSTDDPRGWFEPRFQSCSDCVLTLVEGAGAREDVEVLVEKRPSIVLKFEDIQLVELFEHRNILDPSVSVWEACALLAPKASAIFSGFVQAYPFDRVITVMQGEVLGVRGLAVGSNYLCLADWDTRAELDAFGRSLPVETRWIEFDEAEFRESRSQFRESLLSVVDELSGEVRSAAEALLKELDEELGARPEEDVGDLQSEGQRPRRDAPL